MQLQIVAAFKQKFKGTDNNLRIVTFPEANHLFQEAKTGLPSEYSILDKQFADNFLEEINAWIQAILKDSLYFLSTQSMKAI